jgi:hypothetical protein
MAEIRVNRFAFQEENALRKLPKKHFLVEDAQSSLIGRKSFFGDMIWRRERKVEDKWRKTKNKRHAPSITVPSEAGRYLA